MDKKNTRNKRWGYLFSHHEEMLKIPGIELNEIPFLVYSVTYNSFWRATPFYKQRVLTIEQAVPFPPDLKNRTTTDECLHFQIPHPSYVHIPYPNYPKDRLPWRASSSPRQYLASFIGSIVVSGDKTKQPPEFPTKFFEARWHLEPLMHSESDMIFQKTSSSSKARSGSQYTFALDYYKNTTFCPHIGGDFCHRKAFYDSLLHGCIPVVFDTLNCEWAFKDLIDYSTITLELSYEQAIGQKRFAELLRDVSLEKIVEYRKNIESVAHHLQISLYEDDNDMFGIALKQAKRLLPYYNMT